MKGLCQKKRLFPQRVGDSAPSFPDQVQRLRPATATAEDTACQTPLRVGPGSAQRGGVCHLPRGAHSEPGRCFWTNRRWGGGSGPLPRWPLQWQAGPNQSGHGGDSTLSKGLAAGNEQKTSHTTKINDAHVVMCARRRSRVLVALCCTEIKTKQFEPQQDERGFPEVRAPPRVSPRLALG